jgi:hypothetical protein
MIGLEMANRMLRTSIILWRTSVGMLWMGRPPPKRNKVLLNRVTSRDVATPTTLTSVASTYPKREKQEIDTLGRFGSGPEKGAAGTVGDQSLGNRATGKVGEVNRKCHKYSPLKL